MKNKIVLLIVLVLHNVILLSNVAAQDIGDLEDIEVFGLELEKLLNFGSGLLATGLFIATSFAYKRTRNKRLIYVSIAFLLFAVKGFLTSHELFLEEWSWVDPVASALNFAIILSFFLGVMKK